MFAAAAARGHSCDFDELQRGAAIGCGTRFNLGEVMTTGSIMATCGGGGNCVLDCGNGGQGGGNVDAGGLQCPDGMTCANLGGGRQRCMYVDATGGI